MATPSSRYPKPAARTRKRTNPVGPPPSEGRRLALALAAKLPRKAGLWPGRRLLPAGRPQHAVQVRVREQALRVQPRAHLLECIPLRVARRQRLRRLKMQLPPVRATAVVVHDVLHGLEALLVVRPLVDVHRDVARVPPAGSAQWDIVAGGEPHLHREAEDEAAPAHVIAHPVERLYRRLLRDG